MGFHVKHIKKYVNWLKKDRAAFQDACKISKELAQINRRLNYALLRNQTAKTEAISQEKHRWILNYIEDRCPETLKKYRAMGTPIDLGEPNPEIKVWSMWWQGEENADK